MQAFGANEQQQSHAKNGIPRRFNQMDVQAVKRTDQQHFDTDHERRKQKQENNGCTDVV
jgi:hypothetical protein